METINLAGVIRIASNASLLLPLVFYLRSWRTLSRPMHVVGALVIVSGVSDLAGFVLLQQQQSTVVVFNLYYMVLFGLLTLFYYRILFVHTRPVWAWLGAGAYIASFIAVTAFAQPFTQYQTLLWLITAVIMIVYSLAYFFHSLASMSNSGYFGSGLIWVNIGVMIYFVMNLYLFVMGQHVLTELDQETSSLIWSSHNLNNILKNILFAVGLHFAANEKKTGRNDATTTVRRKMEATV